MCVNEYVWGGGRGCMCVCHCVMHACTHTLTLSLSPTYPPPPHTHTLTHPPTPTHTLSPPTHTPTQACTPICTQAEQWQWSVQQLYPVFHPVPGSATRCRWVKRVATEWWGARLKPCFHPTTSLWSPAMQRILLMTAFYNRCSETLTCSLSLCQTCWYLSEEVRRVVRIVSCRGCVYWVSFLYMRIVLELVIVALCWVGFIRGCKDI